MIAYMAKRIYTDADLTDLEVLGIGDLAEIFNMPAGSLSTGIWRYQRGMSGAFEFPAPHATLGNCKIWFRTSELDEAIKKHTEG